MPGRPALSTSGFVGWFLQILGDWGPGFDVGTAGTRHLSEQTGPQSTILLGARRREETQGQDTCHHGNSRDYGWHSGPTGLALRNRTVRVAPAGIKTRAA